MQRYLIVEYKDVFTTVSAKILLVMRYNNNNSKFIGQ